MQHYHTNVWCHTTKQNVVGGGRLRPRYRHLANWTKRKRRLWFGPFPPLYKTWRHPQNRKYITHRTVVGGEPSHAHRYQHVQKIWWNFDVCWNAPADRKTNRKTDKHTDMPTTILRIHTGGQVMKYDKDSGRKSLCHVARKKVACDSDHAHPCNIIQFSHLHCAEMLETLAV